MRRFLAIGLVVVGLVSPLSAQQNFTRVEPTAKELEAALRTDWFGLYLENSKIGYFKTTRENTPDGIRESILMNMKILSFNQKVDVIVSQSLLFEAKSPYPLVKASFREQFGPVDQRFEWTRTKPGSYDVVQTANKVVRKKTVDGIDYALGDTLASEVWVKRGPAKDSEVKIRDLQIKDGLVDFETSKILGSKTSLVGGVEVKFHEIETASNHQKITSVSDYDDQGKLILGKIGGKFELRAESEAEAKNTEYSKDFFAMGLAKVDKKLGNLQKVQELVLEVEGPAKVFGDGPRQTVVKENGKTFLKVGKRYAAGDKATKEEEAENLKETSAYDLTHPKVKELAARAVGDAVAPEEKVKNIARFVHKFVRPRLSGNMPAIHDLIERKEGDCKSYALLFTTLARANGIPSREVAGLMYVGDDAKAFGGHAWNEVVLNGVWVPIDASLNETEVNATHLCLGTEKLAAGKLLESMGGLKLKVVEVKGK